MNGVNGLTNEIIGAAIEVHRTLGPALLESTYEGCLLHELAERELYAERQKALTKASTSTVATASTYWSRER